MKMYIALLVLLLLGVPGRETKSVFSASSVSGQSEPSQNDNQNATEINGKMNSTTVTVTSNTKLNPVPHHAVRHIQRKRETAPDMPFDFHVKHMPCDVDMECARHAIYLSPNHCKWMWNNKYVHEGFFRVYKIYQVEAFFFGQYYERLKRYEVDPHSWEYKDIEI